MKRIYLIAAAAVLIPFFAACTDDTAPEVTLSASPSSVEIPSDGGTVNVVISTNQDSFEYTGGAEWLNIGVDGMALSLSAEANTEQRVLDCTVTVTAGGRSIDIPVTQAAASRYPGYTEVSALSEAAYSGTLLQMFGQAPEDSEGGQATLVFALDARTNLTVEFFTPAFNSESEVSLPDGTFTLGTDLADGTTYAAVPMTFVKGVARVYDEGTEDEETLYVGTYLGTTVNDVTTYDLVTGGSFTVSSVEGTVTVLMDFSTESGDQVKYYYEGTLDLDASGAMYPSGETDAPEPTEVVSVSGSYNGAAGDGLANIVLTLSTGGITPSTVIDFNIAYAGYSADMDLSGTYTAIDTPLTAVGINKGVSEEQDGFVLASYTYVYLDLDMPTFTATYFIADGGSTMTLEKNLDGTYDITASLKNTAGEGYDYSLTGMSIELYDATVVEE